MVTDSRLCRLIAVLLPGSSVQGPRSSVRRGNRCAHTPRGMFRGPPLSIPLRVLTARRQTMATVELTAENFNSTVTGNGLVLVDFWAEWCPPCRMFGPVFEKASEKHPDAVFGKIDTEAQPEVAATFNITSIPTLMSIRDNIVLFAHPGALPEKALEELITKAEALDMDEVRASMAQSSAQTPAQACKAVEPETR